MKFLEYKKENMDISGLLGITEKETPPGTYFALILTVGLFSIIPLVAFLIAKGVIP